MIEKILERLEEEREIAYADFDKYASDYELDLEDTYDDFFHKGLARAKAIVQEVAKEYGKDTNVRSNEAEQYKLALFGLVRNSKIMPVGIAQGKSIEEINVLSLLTVKEIMGMSNFDALAQIYRDAKEALAKVGDK